MLAPAAANDPFETPNRGWPTWLGTKFEIGRSVSLERLYIFTSIFFMIRLRLKYQYIVPLVSIDNTFH